MSENVTIYASGTPTFPRSVPVETMSLGMMLAMAAIMALHLVFTAPYHYPLSRPNFVLQLIAAVLFLILVAASVGYILWELRMRAMQVPHLFPYLSQPIPPKDGRWTMVQKSL